MSLGAFDNIKRERKSVPVGLDDFVNTAKVDGKRPGLFADLDHHARRGAGYKKENGVMVKLNGRMQMVPINEYERRIIDKAADKAGLTATAFVRSAAMSLAKKSLFLD